MGNHCAPPTATTTPPTPHSYGEIPQIKMLGTYLANKNIWAIPLDSLQERPASSFRKYYRLVDSISIETTLLANFCGDIRLSSG